MSKKKRIITSLLKKNVTFIVLLLFLFISLGIVVSFQSQTQTNRSQAQTTNWYTITNPQNVFYGPRQVTVNYPTNPLVVTAQTTDQQLRDARFIEVDPQTAPRAIQFNGPGKVYVFKAGVYERFTLMDPQNIESRRYGPYEGNVFLGRTGAVFDGKRSTPGFANGLISMGPNGQDGTGISNVTIVNLEFRNYVSPTIWQLAKSGIIMGAKNWKIIGNKFYENVGGLTLGRNWLSVDGSVVSDNIFDTNYFHSLYVNGTNYTIEHNSIVRGGFFDQLPTGMSHVHLCFYGNFKVTDLLGTSDRHNRNDNQTIQIRRNYVASNNCVGIWLDVNVQHATIQENYTSQHTVMGIFVEISRKTKILANRVEESSLIDSGWQLNSAGIGASSSDRVEIYGNYVRTTAAGHGITYNYNSLPSDGRIDYPISHGKAKGNTIVYPAAARSMSGIHNDDVVNDKTTPMEFDCNRYVIPDSNRRAFRYGGYGNFLTFQQFKETGFEQFGLLAISEAGLQNFPSGCNHFANPTGIGTPPQAPPLPPPYSNTARLTLTANGQEENVTVPRNSNVLLGWNTTGDFTTCQTADALWAGSYPINGTRTIQNIQQSVQLGLSCFNSTGSVSVTKYVRITVSDNPSVRITPSSTTVNTGQNITFDVTIDPRGKSVSAMRFDIRYPQDKFSFVSFQKIPQAMQNLPLTVTLPAGAAGIELGAPLGSPYTTPTSVARLTLRAIGAGSANLNFGQETLIVTTDNLTGNSLGATNGTTVTIQSDGSLPPSPTPVPVTFFTNILANGSDGPVTITPGQSVQLQWTTQNMIACATNDPIWVGTYGPQGNHIVPNVTNTTRFNLSCWNATATEGRTDSVVVQVSQPQPTPTRIPTNIPAPTTGQPTSIVTSIPTSLPTRTPTPSPTTVQPVRTDLKVNGSDGPVTLQPGQQITVNWQTTGPAVTCATNDPVWSNTYPTSGSRSFIPSSLATKISLSCWNSTGTSSSTDSVSVSFLIPTPTPTVLSPTVTTAPSVTFELKANNSSNDISLPVGQPLTLSWNAPFATTCATNDALWRNTYANAGSIQINNLQETTTFGLSCWTGAGENSQTKRIKVTVTGSLPQPTPTPTTPWMDFRANNSKGPITITPGQSVVLSWRSNLLTTCATNDSLWQGTYAPQGTRVLSNITTTTRVGLSCWNSDASVSKTEYITINVN